MLKNIALAIACSAMTLAMSSAFGAGRIGADQTAAVAGTDYTVTRTSHLTIGSPEIKPYTDVLADAIAHDGMGSTLADLQKLQGSVEIIMTTHHRVSAGVANNEDEGPRPPVDPSTSGAQDGDTMTFHSCVGNSNKTWNLEFKWDNDAGQFRWVVVGYSSYHVKSCSPA